MESNSEDQKPVETPAVTPLPVPATSGEGVAENYIARELKEAREGLKRTQMGAIIGLVALALYMGIMTARVVNYAQPANAAEVANGIITEQVNNHAEDVAGQFKSQIPTLIASLPDRAIKGMPEAREAFLTKVEGDLRDNAKSSSDELSASLDTFLTSHKDKIKTVMEAGSDREAVKAMGPDLEKELMGYLTSPGSDGSASIKSKVDNALFMLQAMKQRTDRLANTPSALLTPEERKTKRAIALISRTVGKELQGFNARKTIAEQLNPHIDAAAGHNAG